LVAEIEGHANMSDVRARIIETYAQWTAMSALRSGVPIKSRRDVYTVLRAIDFQPLFSANPDAGLIDRNTFDDWHEAAVQCMLQWQPLLNVGWATKIINVYLKTRAYVGEQGRHGLIQVIHPPIDAGLWTGLARRFAENRPDIIAQTNCVRLIKDIGDYGCYRKIIDGCREAAKALNCMLIEVEQLWTGTEFLGRAPGEAES
jgi:hypothetical protein